MLRTESRHDCQHTIFCCSGGKDSCFNLLKCVAENHEVVALANLHPADPAAGQSLLTLLFVLW